MLAMNARARNDPHQYDDLADQWWNPRGPFVTLSWLAKYRAQLVPPAPREGAILVDVACGGGLLHPHLEGKGYVHVGVDLSPAGTRVAREHGLDHVIRADINALPLADESADVVVAGECLEHVSDPRHVVAECCRVLKPGGTFVVDTLANTRLARLLVITLGENLPLPGMAPKGCHDHRLFVNPDRLARACADHGVPMKLRGLLPSAIDFLAWFLRLRTDVRMYPIKSTTVLYQAVGTKNGHRPNKTSRR
jgi:2-polyprenyl-6-hydroxyphenyl methylase/3-demethylubiquinone-9 3-methyltransferase